MSQHENQKMKSTIDIKKAFISKSLTIWQNTLLRKENFYMAICFTGAFFCWSTSFFLPKHYIFVCSVAFSLIFWGTAKNLLLHKQNEEIHTSFFSRLRKAAFRPTIMTLAIVLAILTFRHIFNNYLT